MNGAVCPKYEKCPIFTGTAFKRSGSADVYKNLYCQAGAEVYGICKRFMASNALGKPIPPSVMPNSNKTIEEIAELIAKQEVKTVN